MIVDLLKEYFPVDVMQMESRLDELRGKIERLTCSMIFTAPLRSAWRPSRRSSIELTAVSSKPAPSKPEPDFTARPLRPFLLPGLPGVQTYEKITKNAALPSAGPS